jgi:hypothetical protein
MNRQRDPTTPRGPAARTVVSLALMVVLAVVLLQAASLIVRTFDPAEREQAAWEAGRERAQAERLTWLDTAVAAGWRVLPLLLAAGASGALLRIVNRWGEQRYFDRRYDIALRRAETQKYPAGLQNLSAHWHDSSRHEAIDAEPVEPLSLPPHAAPTFSQLLHAGAVGKDRDLLLGVDAATGDPVAGAWTDLYSTIVAGLPGSGKTTSQRFLACQTALHGAKFVIIDPQQGAGDESLADTLAPLARAMLCAPASDEQSILQAARLVRDLGERRIQGRARDDFPIILWLDEATKLLGHSQIAGDLASLIEQIAQQYRKKAVYVSASGQIWAAVRTGGNSALRDSFASALCHRMKRNQARLILPLDEAAQVEQLTTGQAIFWPVSGMTRTLIIPNTTAQDVAQVGAMLAGSAPPPATGDPRPFGFQRPRHTSVPPTGPLPHPLPDPLPAMAPGSGGGSGLEVGVEVGTSTLPNALNPKAARVRQLLQEKASWNQIIWDVWGVKGGRAWQDASRELQEIVAELVKVGPHG